MAKIVSTDQRIVTGVTNPISVYSRVISIVGSVAAGVGAERAVATPPVAQSVWLRNVQLWLWHSDAETLTGGFFWVLCGSGKVPAGAGILDWENVLPIYSPAALTKWYWVGASKYFSWDMQRLFTGGAKRFGIFLQNADAISGWNCQASFEISEG